MSTEAIRRSARDAIGVAAKVEDVRVLAIVLALGGAIDDLADRCDEYEALIVRLTAAMERAKEERS